MASKFPLTAARGSSESSKCPVIFKPAVKNSSLTEIGSLPNGPRVSIRPWSASTVACVLIVVSLYFKAFCSSTKT